MSTYIISYDLKQPASPLDYTRIVSAIKGCGTWAKGLESFWFVKTSLSASSIMTAVKAASRPGDKIIVIKAGAEWSALGLSQEVVAWMRTNT